MKSIPAQLLSHEAQVVTTVCFLVKVECVGTFAGTVLGFTTLDVDVEYDDLTDTGGAITYAADNGFTPKRIQMSSNQRVDNSEIEGVTTPAGITPQQVRAGMFDSAKMTIYRVNYNDPTAGRHEVMAYGRAGRTKWRKGGFTVEFRSLMDYLKQAIGPLYSLTCRAVFGDAQCGKAFVWTNGTVTSVGAENDRQFSDTSIGEAEGFYDLGVIEWLTGDNAGRQIEIDTHTGDTASGSFDLSFVLDYPIQVGDTYRVRPDCDKTFETCRDTYANNLNFRGENLTPVEGSAMVPGAEIERA